MFKIGNETFALGERKRTQLDVASLFDYTQISVPIEVIRGKEEGPVIFISAAIHGDEINGVEIIKRLLRKKELKNIKGTLIAIPIVNVFGFNAKTRYLPDRRDLNRCFPGSSKGSLGSRLARIFMKEVVSKCTHGIDLHTGAIHRSNLPQVRACLDDPETKRLAKSFGVPVVMNSSLRDGSLREAARKKNIKTLLFEGGEALRFDEDVIKVGVNGCLSVMRGIGMLPKRPRGIGRPKKEVILPNDSYWIRAEHSGSFQMHKKMGDSVLKGEKIATISNPFGYDAHYILAKDAGIIIGMSMIPLVNQGDAMVHIATYKKIAKKPKRTELKEEFYS